MYIEGALMSKSRNIALTFAEDIYRSTDNTDIIFAVFTDTP